MIKKIITGIIMLFFFLSITAINILRGKDSKEKPGQTYNEKKIEPREKEAPEAKKDKNNGSITNKENKAGEEQKKTNDKNNRKKTKENKEKKQKK